MTPLVRRRALAWSLGFLLLVAITGTMLLDWLFEEPRARPVPSLVEELESRSVLGIFAHPDDEILVCGTLADAARRGCDVRTVTATRGERGVPRGFTGTKADLLRLREQELRGLGTRLGFRGQLLWDFPDSGLSTVPIETLRDSVRLAIHRFKPDLIVTLDSTAGFTGHVDHRRMGEAVLAAVAMTDSPSTSARWLARILAPRRTAEFFPAESGNRLRRQPPADVAVAADARTKLLAMEIHASQQQYFPPGWFRPILYRFYDREHFVLTRLRSDR